MIEYIFPQSLRIITMKQIFSFLCPILLFVQTILSAEIIEISNFSSVKNYIDQDTLLILDIDDTLLIPCQMLGCDEWFMARMKEKQENGFSFDQALDKTLFEWEGLRSLTEMNLCEENISSIIQELQEQNVPMMCLTTQRFALGPRTVYQLTHHNIFIKKTAPIQENTYFTAQNLGILFFEGILFTNGTHKGKTFFQFCDLNQYTPKKIVFVNDKGSHLKEIEKTAAERKIPFIGLRYAYSDKKKAQFDYEIAKIQANHLSLEGIISDLRAEEKK